MADPIAIWGGIGATPIASAAICSDLHAVLEPVPEPPPEPGDGYDYPIGHSLLSDYGKRWPRAKRYIIGRR